MMAINARWLTVCAGTALTLALGGPATAGPWQALEGGEASMDYRLRLETVSQDNLDEDATAVTGRLRLGYGTQRYAGFEGFVEMEDVTPLGGEAFNSTRNAETDRPVIADPDDTEVNRAYVAYRGFEYGAVQYGRQRIIFDNARFVGNVGWRQNEQTYDAARLDIARNDVQLSYAFVSNVNTVTFRNRDMDSHLVHLAYEGLPRMRITAYGYLLDFDDPAGATVDSRTLGVRLSGGAAQRFTYAAEYARQDDYGESGPRVGANYYRLQGGVRLGPAHVELGREVLSGDGEFNFQTPLATKHAFNGWADIFLSDRIGIGNSADGLRDSFVRVSGELREASLKAVYHRFEADRNGVDYGREIDLSAAYPLGEHVHLMAKYAHYEAERFASDTRKFWLQGQLSF